MFFLLKDLTTRLPGIGPNLAQRFTKLEIFNLKDLIDYYPRKWEDLSQIVSIDKVVSDQKVTIKAKLLTLNQFRSPYRRFHVTNAVFQDSTGNLRITWFNQPYLATSLKKEQIYFLSGKVKNYQSHPTLINPSVESADQIPLHSGRIIAIYPTTKGISSKFIRRNFKYLTTTIRSIPETLPTKILKQYNLIGLSQALANIHFPSSLFALSQAKRRLSFEELLPIHFGIILTKRHWIQSPGLAISPTKDFLKHFTAQLDFKFTPSQEQAFKEIITDLSQPHPMNRLLFGDVGSGKTIVAAGALVATVQAGFQAALMAPTEILATQHYQNLQPLMKKFKIKTTLLTGHTKLDHYSKISSGAIDIIIGTHALIQQQVIFKNLNLVIVDEQHRFGVRQRQKLKNKAQNTIPHFLSLSATPIPRTLFLGLLNDLDVSWLTHLPQGRLPVTTRLVTENNFNRVIKLIKNEIEKHHQIFVITPLIHDDLSLSSSPLNQQKQKRASILSEKKNLSQLFPHAKIRILHGQIEAVKKLKIMNELQTGKLDIVLATSIIEVGIDIPSATIIWIKDADRFGLAQLHQLRGRVGRSNLQSYCLIETASDNPDTLVRLKSFIHINDGSKLAEIDLKLRGPGSFFDSQQSGFFKLKLADLTDKKLIKETRVAAEDILQLDPTLKNYPQLKNKIRFNYPTHEE